MAINPKYQLGRHLISCVVTPQTVAANGAVSDTTPVATISAKMRALRNTLRATNEEISPLNSTRDNMVRTSDGHSLSLDVLKVNDGTDASPLRTLFMAADILKVSWTEGTGASQKVVTGYYTRGEYNDGFEGKGGTIASLTLDPVDVGANTFTIS